MLSLSGLQTGNGTNVACWIVAVIIVLMLVVYLVLYFYQRRLASKRLVQHLCDYCGHMVTVVSDCCHEAVKVSFMRGICLNCKKECKVVCSRCKRPI
jgi:hypothetical protein